MQAATQLFATAVEGGVPPDEYDRADAVGAFAALWRDGIADGPRFRVEGPFPLGGRLRGDVRERPDADRWGAWVTEFAYEFDPRVPWFAEQVVEAFRAEFERLDAAGAFHAPRLVIKLQLNDETGANEAPFPRTAALTPARTAALNHGHAHTIAVVARAAVTEDDWATLLQRLAQEDRYDVLDGVEGAFGNRMSRVVLSVNEWRIPRGAGVAEELGVPPRSVVDLPLPPGAVLCGQACLAYALASESSRAHYREPERQTALNAAKAMAKTLGVEGAMVVADFDTFADRHPQHTVVVMEGKEQVLYRTVPGERYTTPIYLLLHRGHYYFIPRIEAFAKATRKTRVSWCHGCAKLVRSRDLKHHACEGRCRRCLHRFVSDADREAHYADVDGRCPLCNFPHRFEGCKALHRCTKWLCLACERIYPKARKGAHRCGERYCPECDEYYGPSGGAHRCYVLGRKAGRVRENVWAYDVESTQDPATHAHDVALVVATRLYTRETQVFRAPGTAAEDFLAWIEGGGAGRAPTFVAHNGSGYDSYLVLHEIKRRRIALPEKLIMVGQKVMYMKYRGARFIDSMQHVAGSLERLAKTFGLPQTKGFFPYTFFTRDRLDYAGEIPDAAHFAPERMGPGRREDFEAWYDERALDSLVGDDYNLMEEAVKYCRLDVELLAGALEKYRDAGLEATGVDPLQRATIAAYAQDVYRANFMPPKTLPVLTRAEYDFVRRGFYGGRTDARQVLRRWTPEEAAAGGGAAYVDVVSLYPTVMRHDALPVGAPWWAEEVPGTEEESARFLAALEAAGRLAVVECDVECPRDLYHPVLLEKRGGRLVAALDIRSGVWPSNELALALKHGYRVTRIRRALVSETEVGAAGFGGYVDAYVGQKAAHAPHGPEPNVGRYLLAKMMLNSLWGKFGQRDAAQESRFYSGERGPEAWYRTVQGFHDGALEALDVHEVNEDYLFATATKAGGENLHLRTTDLLLAAFVTANARLRLYAALDLLGERVIYHDTDSVVYEKRPGEPDIPTGTALGEWSDETGGDPVVEFVGLGPKTYAYRTLRGKTCVKSKGFSSGFTLEQYRGLAEAFLAGLPTAPLEQGRLHFKRAGGRITTIPSFTKKLAVSLQKVHVVSASRTVPFGHVEAE